MLTGRLSLLYSLVVALASCLSVRAATEVQSAGPRRLNNLVSELVAVSGANDSDRTVSFSRPGDGWIFISLRSQGKGTIRVRLDGEAPGAAAIVHDAASATPAEAMRYVQGGTHHLEISAAETARLESLDVRSIPELIHSGLGYDPQIKSFGHYDLKFLSRDVLPNVTTLIVPSQIQLAPSEIADWHRQGKRFVAEVGVDGQAKSAEDHFRYWSRFFDQASFLDGIIIDEFIVNLPVVEWAPLTPERLARMERERQQYTACGQAIEQLHTDPHYRGKMIYAYIGGSGKKLNQEIIGTNFLQTIMRCGDRIALERYLHEMSSEQGSTAALRTFVDGITDWEAKEPGIKKQMIITFGLFSMPPGGINKQPNVDYHVWMDEQMHLVANRPELSNIAGLNWWTSSLADEETVRFVGKLYRHYAVEGQTNRLTSDPLFLTHIDNADFEKGTEGWTLHPAEPGGIDAKSFPRYGRIEGRYMGLGRPADPEHIGDTFLFMKRSEKGPNTFSQTIRDLQPGRLYSMEMFTCDYQDLLLPKAKKQEDATPFLGTVTLEGVDVDRQRSFREMYSSSPEPKIPIWITYHWTVFRAKASTAKITVSDWPDSAPKELGFGQEQTFNFVEIQPYHE